MMTEAALFIAQTLAATLVGEVGKKTYARVKARLIGVFGLGTRLDALEANPTGEAEQQQLAGALASSAAAADAELLAAMEALIAELAAARGDTPIAAGVTIADIRAGSGVIERIRAGAGADVTIKGLTVDGKLTIRDISAGEPPRRD